MELEVLECIQDVMISAQGSVHLSIHDIVVCSNMYDNKIDNVTCTNCPSAS